MAKEEKDPWAESGYTLSLSWLGNISASPEQKPGVTGEGSLSSCAHTPV